MTNYSELLDNNKMKRERISQRQVVDCLNLAKRDVRTAKAIAEENYDWTYNIAYNAMLQAARAFMLSKGFRPTGEGQHITAIRFAQSTLGDEYRDVLDLMDRMRRKRHKTVYDMAGLISAKEAEEAIKTAVNFVSTMDKTLGRR